MKNDTDTYKYTFETLGGKIVSTVAHDIRYHYHDTLDGINYWSQEYADRLNEPIRVRLRWSNRVNTHWVVTPSAWNVEDDE